MYSTGVARSSAVRVSDLDERRGAARGWSRPGSRAVHLEAILHTVDEEHHQNISLYSYR